MKEYTDNEIIECLRARQSYVVRFLHDRYLPMIRLMVTGMGGTAEDAMDIFQDGLMIMIEKLDNREFTLTCKFKTYLYCVCENLWKSILTKRKAAQNYFLRKVDDEDDDFTESMDGSLYESIFHAAFETLDPAARNILKLYWEEVSPREIAEKLGYSYAYVRKKKCEAQAELILKVKKHPDYLRIMKHKDPSDDRMPSSQNNIQSDMAISGR